MNQEEIRRKQVNGEVNRICNFLSLKISYIVLLILLAFTSAVQMLNQGVIVTFWLLIVGMIVPLFADRLSNMGKEKSGEFVLTTLAAKYKYTEAKYQSLSNAFLLELLLLLLWQYANRRRVIDDYIISMMPTGLVFVAVLTRLSCYFSYRVLIKYKMKYNCF